MPNRLEWEDVQVRYKDALQSYLASKEKPVDVEDEVTTKDEIPVITISDDNEAVENEAHTTAAEVSAPAEIVDDDKNSVKKSDEEPMAVEAAEKGGDGVKEEAAVVVNPDSSITDKALTENPKKTEV